MVFSVSAVLNQRGHSSIYPSSKSADLINGDQENRTVAVLYCLDHIEYETLLITYKPCESHFSCSYTFWIYVAIVVFIMFWFRSGTTGVSVAPLIASTATNISPTVVVPQLTAELEILENRTVSQSPANVEFVFRMLLNQPHKKTRFQKVCKCVFWIFMLIPRNLGVLVFGEMHSSV